MVIEFSDGSKGILEQIEVYARCSTPATFKVGLVVDSPIDDGILQA